VYLKCFSAISFIARFCHSLFLKRFCGYSCFNSLEFSEASRSGWNYFLLHFRFIHMLNILSFTHCDAFQIHPVFEFHKTLDITDVLL
jgi:hypothetical protein